MAVHERVFLTARRRTGKALAEVPFSWNCADILRFEAAGTAEVHDEARVPIGAVNLGWASRGSRLCVCRLVWAAITAGPARQRGPGEPKLVLIVILRARLPPLS